jgi:hypothetical protein
LFALNKVFDRNAWPTTGDRILLVHDTGLSKQEVQAWFEMQRKGMERDGLRMRGGKRMRETTIGEMSKLGSRMWRAYRKDSEGMWSW